MENGMELEQGEVVEEVRPSDPLDLEEGELREDDPTPAGSTGMESDSSAGEEQECKRERSGKRRSEGTAENGDERDDHEYRHSKRSKKSSSSSSSKGHRNSSGERKSDEEDARGHKISTRGLNGTDEHGADGDGDGGKTRKKREDRSSANHHRHHRDGNHHRDKKEESSGSSGDGNQGGTGGSKRSRSSVSPSSDRRSDSDDRRHHRSVRESERDRGRDRSRDREKNREKGRDGERDPRRYERGERERTDSRSGRGNSSDRDSRGDRRSSSRDRVGESYRRRTDDYGSRDSRSDYRRGDRRDYRDDRESDRRISRREEEEAAERKRKEEEELRKKKEEEERYAKMIEEELRLKEKEQTEEEKAQKLIEERRRRRQAILEKYKQDKSQTELAEIPNSETASAVNRAVEQSDVVQAPQDAAAPQHKLSQEVIVEATAPANSAAAVDEKQPERSDKGEQATQQTKPAPKPVTHFDMFAELPASLVPSPEKLNQPARAAAANGEDELHLQDNWDDEEGYYSFRIGEVINKRYTVHASHGKGVFSTVLMAKDSRNNDAEVAIKVIRNNDTMFRAGLKEKDLLEKITKADPKDKRHCIRAIDSFQYRNHLCLVLEPMNLNLREVVRKFGRDVGITMQAVRTYARQLFIALKHLKSLNIIHADLKPDNIVLNQKLTVLKLCDFGSASTMDEENAITPYLVSRYYRAPEIMLGLPYDFAIDTWAAGCCLYEMYTGKILYLGKSNNEMLKLQMDAMGPFPRKMLRKSKFWQRHFNTQTFYFQQICVDEVSQQEYVKEVNVLKPVRDLRAEMQRAATSEDVAQVGHLADLLLKCLILDPAKRITPEQALAHPFLAKAM